MPGTGVFSPCFYSRCMPVCCVFTWVGRAGLGLMGGTHQQHPHTSSSNLMNTQPPQNNAITQALVGLATGHAGWQTRLGCAGLCWRVAEMLRRWPDDYGTQLSGTLFPPLRPPSPLPVKHNPPPHQPPHHHHTHTHSPSSHHVERAKGAAAREHQRGAPKGVPRLPQERQLLLQRHVCRECYFVNLS